MIEWEFPTNRDFISLSHLVTVFILFFLRQVKFLQEQFSAQKRKLNETANKVKTNSIKAPHTLYFLKLAFVKDTKYTHCN